jgi:hypothetical protein
MGRKIHPVAGRARGFLKNLWGWSEVFLSYFLQAISTTNKTQIKKATLSVFDLNSILIWKKINAVYS